MAGHLQASIIASISGDPVAFIHWTWSDIVQINVWLSRAAVEDVSVNWQTVDDTALAGVDYTAASGVLQFKRGESSKMVEVDVLPQTTSNARQFFIQLSDPVNAAIADAMGECWLIPVYANGPLVKAGLVTNAYDRQNGRGNYFHFNAGTSEGQSIGIEGALRAARVLLSGSDADKEAAGWYRLLGIGLLNAIGAGSRQGPMLRQPFPTSADTITLLHWLFAAKGAVPGQDANYQYVGVVENGKIKIPRTDIYNVWQIYPTDAYLLYESPFSPAYDDAGNQVGVAIADWEVVGSSTVITIPSGAPAKSQWKVVFGFYQGSIPQGAAFEAYPFWTKIPDGYAACAPDTFRWFDIAITEAIKVIADGKWSALRAALRKSAVRGQAVTDLREVLKPLPGLPVFPASGDPDGMFCYSSHASAVGGQGGAGSNFWTRDAAGNIKGSVPAGNLPVQTQLGRGFNDAWRDATSYQDADGFLWLQLSCSSLLGSNGYKSSHTKTITIKKTASGFDLTAFGETVSANVIDGDLLAGLYGTGNPFVSGAANKAGTYGNFVIQTAGYCQFTLDTANAAVAALTTGQTLTETLNYQVEYTGNLFVFVSGTKNYDANRRWYADLKSISGWSGVVTAHNAGQLVNFYIPRTAFKRKDSDNAVLPAGTLFENFGISIEHPGGYSVVVGNMRMVKDATAAARKGSKMPYFPGAMPFAINADTVAQQFVGWNGSPFHGYQLPDHWFVLGQEADAVHPGLLPADLTVADPTTGVLSAPISATDTDGRAKPKAAMLAEQQLYFLKHAQMRWQIDGGDFGPFAHTFVLNTPARMSIGNPTPHTWVYTNDDPNTRWAGYQVRVVESLARLTWITRFAPGYLTARAMAAQMAVDWLGWLNTAWPDLTGEVRGMPTDFPDPRISAPTAWYEEPHSPAVVLRACIWLKLAGFGNATTLDAIVLRCWEYLESLWVTAGPMRYTWSANPDDGEWFGFWHFEIVTTISVMLDEGAGVRPPAITASILRERLRLTSQWLQDTGVE